MKEETQKNKLKEDVKSLDSGEKELEAELGNPNLISREEKILSMIGYVSFFCMLPLILRPESKFCQFHGMHGLVLTISFIVFSFFSKILGLLLGSFFPLVISLSYAVLVCYLIFEAFQGKQRKIPMISEIAEKIKW